MRFLFGLSLLSLLSFASAKTLHHQLHSYTFADYVKEFNKVYDSNTEYNARKQLFETRLAGILAHNANPSKTYKQGVNHLVDRTDEEFSALLGYDAAYTARHAERRAAKATKRHSHSKQLPNEVDWRSKSVVTPVKDQGNCGSCWTFGTSETVESHYAIKYGNLPVLSEQQIADCSPNPKHCGGTGGCAGGTAEIGLEGIIASGGLASEWTYPYISYFGSNFNCSFNATKTRPVAKVTDYVVLPPNEEQPILNAVATIGPLAISADAGSWSLYESGVFSDCPTNPTNQTDRKSVV